LFFASAVTGAVLACALGSVHVLADGHHGACNVCHVQNEGITKNVSSPEHFGCNPHTTCAHYAGNSCCTWKTAILVGAPGGLNAALYGAEWGYERCGLISDKCNEYLQHEACFYECDVNVGRYRYHSKKDCSENSKTGNAWQIANVPIKASFCDAWFEACKDDVLCAAADATEKATIFDAATLNCGASECRRTVAEVWGTAKNFCENSFASDGIPAFRYEVNETIALTMLWDGNKNPNNDVTGMPDFPTEHCVLYNGTWSPSLAHCNITPSTDCGSPAYNDLKEVKEVLKKLEAERGNNFLEKLGGSGSASTLLSLSVVLAAVATNLA